MVKADIAVTSQEIKRLDEVKQERLKELRELDTLLNDKRKSVSSFVDSSADVFNKGIESVKGAISQRKKIEENINKLEKAKAAVEVEIAERQKKTFVNTGLQFVNQAIVQVKKELDVLTKATKKKEDMHRRLEREIANLEVTNIKLAEEKKAGKSAVKALVVQAKEAEQRRSDVLRELAKEEAKARSIRKYERDITVMRKRLTDEYKKVYKSKSRRSTI